MIDSNRLHSYLVEELHQVGFSMSKVNYFKSWDQIFNEGNAEFESLLRMIGERRFDKVMSKSKFARPRRDCARILGFGFHLTHYLTFEIKDIDANERIFVHRLGALANLIVTIYDHFLDHGLIKKHQLIENCLKSIFRNDIQNSKNSLKKMHNRIEFFLIDLIKEYFDRIRSLRIEETKICLLKKLNDTIGKMYQINLQVEQQTTSNQDQLLMEKSTLPFLTMALPIWLFAASSQLNNIDSHLLKINHFGEFIGWLDDAIDIHDDEINGQGNLVINYLSANSDVTLEFVARRIAEFGRIVKEENEVSLSLNDALTLCVLSWLGEEYRLSAKV